MRTIRLRQSNITASRRESEANVASPKTQYLTKAIWYHINVLSLGQQRQSDTKTTGNEARSTVERGEDLVCSCFHCAGEVCFREQWGQMKVISA